MSKKKILVVDDDGDVLSVLEERLSAKGYTVIKADNGNEALELAQSKHPDLIVLDILMTGMYGGEVAAALREKSETKDIPIIFLSCLYSNPEDAAKDLMIGRYTYISKPYDSESLMVVIEKELRQKVHSVHTGS